MEISNFQYVSGAAANQNILSVQVNGETYTTANTVVDSIVAATEITFLNSLTGEELRIDTTGQDATITNIRTDFDDRAAFINALNVGFSRAGGAGIKFAVGAESTDTIQVQIADSSSTALYGGQALNVSSAAEADTASAALEVAIRNVTAIRADVGALQSRFDFASANVES